jgi:transcriptional regulator with XRE-family HTH domain
MQKSLHSNQLQTMLALLRQARLGVGVTQEVLSERIGLSQSDISKVERGARRLDLLELRTWLQGLGVPLHVFVTELEDAIAADELVTSELGGRRKRKVART